MSESTEIQYQKQIAHDQMLITGLKERLRIAKEALNKIKRWDEDLEDEWGDPGYFAESTLQEIHKL